MSDSRPNDCPFCSLPPERVIDSNPHALAIADAFPVSRGHTLVILRRHNANYFDLSEEELIAAHELLRRIMNRLDTSLKPAGYNIGVNIGETAGQTVMHLHIHMIPRYPGDTSDPTGGVRNVIPGKALYRGAGL